MSFNPEQSSEQNKNESKDVVVPEQGKEEFYVENNPKVEIQNCSNLKELSDVLARLETVIEGDNYVTKEEMKKVSDLCRDAQFTSNEDSIEKSREKFLARQNEVPEVFGLREKYIQLIEDEFNMHPTTH